MIRYQSKPSTNTPDGPEGEFLWGNTRQFMHQRFDMMRKCAEDFDGIAFVRIAFRNVFVISKPEYIYHILQKRAKVYHKSANYDGLRPFLGNGLLTSEGESWFAQRRLMQPAFHKERLSGMVDTMVQRIRESIEHWQAARPEATFDLGEEMRHLASDIVTRSLFGQDVNQELNQAVGSQIEVLLAYANDKIVNPFKLPLSAPTKQNRLVREAIANMDEIIAKIVDERLQSKEQHHDLLQMLLDARDADTGEAMSHKQLRDELMTLYLAGQETTQHALTYAFFLLAKHPEVLETLHQEAKTVLQGPEINAASVAQLDYARQVASETMRLYPPVWAISRRAMETDEIGGYTIPKDSTVFIPIWAMHRHQAYWDDPTEFQPSRFEREDAQKRPRNVYFPFGSGARICIGNHFAMMEMQLVLAMVAKELKPMVADQSELPLITQMTMRPGRRIEVVWRGVD